MAEDTACKEVNGGHKTTWMVDTSVNLSLRAEAKIEPSLWSLYIFQLPAIKRGLVFLFIPELWRLLGPLNPDSDF
jgi:hypothetical protein